MHQTGTIQDFVAKARENLGTSDEYLGTEEKFFYSPLAYIPAAVLSIVYLLQLQTLINALETDPFTNENQALL